MIALKQIAINAYAYPLPEDRIAKFPLPVRGNSKLLVFRKGEISETTFSEIGKELPQDTLLLFNDTKVVQARLFFQKKTGATIEIFCLEPIEPENVDEAFRSQRQSVWRCLIGNNKRWKEPFLERSCKIEGKDVVLEARKIRSLDDAWEVAFSWTEGYTFSQILTEMGVIPLPPYLHREAKDSDKKDYQTVLARAEGSVAAPTAGLHFTREGLQLLKETHGVEVATLTLHVGAGTFKPVSSLTIGEHKMHAEKICIDRATIERLIASHNKIIIPVGTTSVRTLESLYWHAVKRRVDKHYGTRIQIEQWDPYTTPYQIAMSMDDALREILKDMNDQGEDFLMGETQLMIAPGYRYRCAQGMITNFHQPQSTLLLLVSAMIGDEWKNVYTYALEHDFRFLSYGDGCLFLP